APGGNDAARHLTPRGRAKMRAAAAGIRALGVHLDVLLTSPLPRAADTAQIVASVFGRTPQPRTLPALAPGVAPAEDVRALKALAHVPGGRERDGSEKRRRERVAQDRTRRRYRHEGGAAAREDPGPHRQARASSAEAGGLRRLAGHAVVARGTDPAEDRDRPAGRALARG